MSYTKKLTLFAFLAALILPNIGCEPAPKLPTESTDVDPALEAATQNM